MNKRPSILDIAEFGVGNLDMGRPVARQTTPNQSEQRTREKEAQVELSTVHKKALYGSEAEQRVLSTSVLQGNDLTKDEQIIDAQTLNETQYYKKYGEEAWRRRAGFIRQIAETQDLKNRERTTEDVWKDSAISGGLALSDMVGGVAGLAALGVDTITGANLSPLVAQGVERVNEFGRSKQSDLMQERRVQHSIEGELDKMDREAQYQRDLQEGDDNLLDWFKKQGTAVSDTVMNYADDPIMIVDKIPEGIASVAGFAGIIRAAGRKMAKQSLKAKGLTTGQAAKFLKTDEGKALINMYSERAAPAIVGVVEGGSSAQQTQQVIMSMSEDELMESADYREMIDSGMTPDEAKMKLSKEAARVAATVAIPGAMVAGKLSSKFISNPFGVGAKGGVGSALTGAGSNLARETVEEASQEGLSQFASNLGQATSGLDVDLDEGVVEAATEGAIGGALSTGPLQAPGAAIGSVTEISKATWEGLKTSIEATNERVAENIDKDSPVGREARSTAANNAVAIADSMLEETQQVTEKGKKAKQTEKTISETLEKGLFLDPEKEVADQKRTFPNLTERENGKISRLDVIEEAGKVLNTSEDDQTKLVTALGMLMDYKDLDRLESNDMLEAIEGLPENSEMREKYKLLEDQLSSVRSSPEFEKAKDLVSNLTRESLEQLGWFSVLQDENTPIEEKRTFAKQIEAVALTKPTEIKASEYETFLNQMDEDESFYTDEDFQVIESARDFALRAEETQAKKEQIEAEQTKNLGKESRKYVTTKTVREDILLDDNRDNKLPSINTHWRNVVDAYRSGETESAKEALFEAHEFARSMLNKAEAVNTAARENRFRAEDGVTYQAYGPYKKWFEQEDLKYGKGIWIQKRSPESVAFARDVFVDTETVVGTAMDLMKQFPDLAQDLEPLNVPEIDSSIALAPSAQTVAESDAVSEFTDETGSNRRLRSDAVSKASEALVEDEAPSPVREAVVQRTKRKRKKTIRPRTTPRKRPFVDEMKAANLFINPESEIGRELINMGVRRGDVPGLFRDDGLSDVDNLEVGNAYFDEVLTRDDTENYYDRNSVIDAILSEANGSPVQDFNEAALSQAQEERAKENDSNVETEANQERKADPASETEQRGETTDNEQGYETGSQETDARREGDAGKQVRAGDVTDGQSEVVQAEADSSSTEQEAGQTKEEQEAFDEVTAADTSLIDEVAEESESEPEQTTPNGVTTVQTWFKELPQRLYHATKDRVNYFLQSYRPNSVGSTFVSHVDPANYLVNQIDSLMSDNNGLERELTAEEAEHVKTLLGDDLQTFSEKLQTMLETKLTNKSKKAKQSLLERMKEQQDILNYDELKSLNFLVRGPTGINMMLDPTVVQAAYMSALEWVIENSIPSRSNLDDEDVSKMFGMGRDTSGVTEDMREFARQGENVQRALDIISRKMEALLGVQPNKDVPADQTQGIMRSMAANALAVLEDMKFIESDTIKTSNKKTISIAWVNKAFWDPESTGPVKEMMDSLRKIPDVFTSAFTPGFDKSKYIKTPPKRVATSQLRNKAGKLSKMERKVIERLQNIPSYVNEPMLALVNALGDDLYKELLGKKTLNEAQMNQITYKSQKGKNLSLDRGLAETRAYIQAMEEQAAADGVALRDMPVFHEWLVSTVGRLQQQGTVTPQGDKTTRELLTATRDTVFLADETQVKSFWLAVAQSLDISIEKQPHKDTVAEVQNLVEKDLAGAVQALEEWQQSGTLDAQAFKEGLGDLKVTPKALHALLAVAQYNKAVAEGATEMEVSLAIEADGKTDGPINAMIHMGTKLFNKNEIERFAKGGLFFTSQELSLSQFMELEKRKTNETHKDLYQVAAEIFHKDLDSKLKQGVDGSDFNILRFLDQFLDDFSMGVTDEGRPKINEIGRNITKNPLTVFLYGSGVNGIADKITKAAMDNVYAMLTDLAAGASTGSIKNWRDLKAFKENPELRNIMESVLSPQEFRQMMTNPRKFELSLDTQNALSARIKKAFAEPMLVAVDAATGGLQSNMRLTQKASQIQAYIFRDILNRKMNQKREELGLTKNQMMTENQMQDVFQETMRLAPIYKTDAQEFHIAAQRKESSSTIHVSRSLTSQFASAGQTPTAADPSVKVSPYMTIGTGDGRMIMNIYANSDGTLEASLPVFDGVELSVPSAIAGSRQINQATFEAWMDSNIFESLNDGFKQMSDYLDPKKKLLDFLDFDTVELIDQAMEKGEYDATTTVEEIIGLQGQLARMADMVAARKYAISKLQTQTDHMAGAEAPANNGEVTTETDDPLAYEEIAEKLNEYVKEYMAQLKMDRAEKKTQKIVQEPTEAFTKFVNQFGEVVPEFEGVQKVQGSQLVSYLGNDPDVSREQKSLIGMLKSKDETLAQATYYFGSPEALTQVRDTLYPDMPKGSIQSGQYHTAAGGVVFITNLAPETALHEMLHSHTYRILKNFYKDPSSVSQEQRDAIGNLQDLMATAKKLRADTRELALLKTALDRASTEPAAEMSEFISWTLSNQDLIQKMKEKRYYPVGNLIRKGLNALKKLLGIKQGPGETLFSNIRFNTEALISTPDQTVAAEQDTETNTILNQIYEEDSSHLSRIEQKYLTKLRGYLEAERPEPTDDPAADYNADQAYTERLTDLEIDTTKATEQAAFHGYSMNPRQGQAFAAIYKTMISGMQLDPATMRQANTLYGHVVKNLKAEDLLAAQGFEDNYNDSQYAAALDKVNFLSSADGLRTTANGRSDLLATFLALGEIDPDLRKALSQMDPPKTIKLSFASVDDVLRSLGQTIINLLTRMSFSRPTMSKNVTQELDRLADALGEVQSTRRYMATVHKLEEYTGRANDFTSDLLNTGAKKTRQFLSETGDKFTNQKVKGAFKGASLIAGFASKDEALESGAALTNILNASPKMDLLRSALSDFRGATPENKSLLRLLNPVRAFSDAVRQDYREGVPENLAARFNRKLTTEEWGQIHEAGAKTDLLVMGRRRALALMKNPDQLPQRITVQEEKLSGLAKKNGDLYKAKAKALAQKMIKGKTSTRNLLKNAYAIAHLYNEKPGAMDDVTPQLIQAIDELTSLYAFDLVDQASKDKLKELIETEPNGMDSVVGTIHHTREAETERRDARGQTNMVAKINGMKGYVPSLVQNGGSIVVEDDKFNDEMVRKGYVRIGDYIGDRAEGYKGKRGYYQSTVAGQAAYRQGVAQSVHETWMGVDARTGQTKHTETAGVIYGAKVRQIAPRAAKAGNNLQADVYLEPVFDENGDVVAYERPLDPDMMSGIKKDKHLGRMLGVWMGRIAEESVAADFNKQLLEALKESYDNMKDTTPEGEFVNVADPDIKDPVIKDAWNTLGWRMKQQAAEIFGESNYVPVRRDQVSDAIGHRAATVTDPWTGISRFSPETQNQMKKLATAIFGKNAYKRLYQGQKLVHGAVSYAKTTIIVRSLSLTVENMMSNVLQLSMHGISPLKIIPGLIKKFIETTQYVKNLEEIQSLKIDMAANYNKPNELRRTEARIQALEDANKQLTIAPLIEAGEFNTISENLTEQDVALREGSWADYLETLTDKLPSWAGVVAKNLLITKDTALFQGLNRMVQYGDFISKGVLYDHLTESQGMEKREALDVLMEEFVQYNRLAGRGRDFLESNGLLWFWNYKLRIQKIAAKVVRDRPLTALFMMGGVAPNTGVDSVWNGSLGGTTADGSVWRSIGPGMGFSAPTMHPLNAMIN